MWMYWMPLDRTLKNGEDGQFYVVFYHNKKKNEKTRKGPNLL